MSDAAAEQARVGSVVNAIAILKHLASSPPQGVNAIARAVSLNPSSCFNLLKTLTGEALLEFDPQAKTYRPGPVPAWLLPPRVDFVEWTQWLRRELDSIAQSACVTCGLWQKSGDRLALLEVAESPSETRIHLTVGQRLPSHIGAMGRCVAAREQVKKSDVGRIISELRWQEPPTASAYWSDMQLANERGWAIDAGNYLRGVTTIAACIGVREDPPHYFLTSTLFSGQYERSALAQLGERTAVLAAEAGRRLAKFSD